MSAFDVFLMECFLDDKLHLLRTTISEVLLFVIVDELFCRYILLTRIAEQLACSIDKEDVNGLDKPQIKYKKGLA